MFSPPRDVEAVARHAIGDDAVESAIAEGRRLTLDEAIAYSRAIANG